MYGDELYDLADGPTPTTRRPVPGEWDDPEVGAVELLVDYEATQRRLAHDEGARRRAEIRERFKRDEEMRRKSYVKAARVREADRVARARRELKAEQERREAAERAHIRWELARHRVERERRERITHRDFTAWRTDKIAMAYDETTRAITQRLIAGEAISDIARAAETTPRVLRSVMAALGIDRRQVLAEHHAHQREQAALDRRYTSAAEQLAAALSLPPEGDDPLLRELADRGQQRPPSGKPVRSTEFSALPGFRFDTHRKVFAVYYRDRFVGTARRMRDARSMAAALRRQAGR